MKTEYLILTTALLFAGAPSNTFAQNNCVDCIGGFELASKGAHVLKVDFKNRCKAPDLSLLKLSKGDFYMVQIDNLNLNLYRVELDAKDTTITQALTFPSFASISVDAIRGLLGEITTSVAAPVVGPAPAVVGGSDEKLVRDEQRAQYSKLDAFVLELAGLSKRIDQLNLDVNLYQLKFNSEFQCGATYESLNASKTTFATVLEEAKNIRTALGTLQTGVRGANEGYLAFSAKYEKLINDMVELNKNHASIKGAYSGLGEAVSKGLESVGSDKILATLKAAVLLENNGALGYRSLPIQYNGGNATVRLKITPLDLKSNLQTYASTWKFPVNSSIYCGVSSSFYVSDLYDETFSTNSTVVNDSTTTYSLVTEGRGVKEIGAAVKFAFGYKICQGPENDLGIHLTIGPGVNVSSPIRPRLLYGLGLAYGRKHMLMLDAGWITGYVDRRSNAFPTDGGYSERPERATVSRTVTGGFVSVGYMFTL